MKTSPKVHKSAYVGLFVITLTTIMYEILLTRIFSVTMWYHFAFMAVSIALFGMTVGAIIVYLFPDHFAQRRIHRNLATSAMFFPITVVASFWIHLSIPLQTGQATSVTLLWNFAMISIPFIFSGINVCLMLTKFPGQVGRLYAADLGGAAIGCILIIYLLDITDGPSAVLVVAALAGVGAFLYASDSDHRRLKRATSVSGVLLVLLAGTQMVLISRRIPLLRLKWAKGEAERPLLHETWNSFSRVRVWGDPDSPLPPDGAGISTACLSGRRSTYLMMDIDASASTVITAFDGDLQEVDFLKCDIVNLAHFVRPDSDVLVVGTGGGRDILSALVFEQNSVTGVEINENIIDLVTETYGDFSGRLDRMPGVRFVHDEARSYITRSEDKFDIIQVSLIDTWAATASGAFVLTENSLYTVEAWKIFLERLTSNGVLTFSRWYRRDNPGEVYRIATLASASLMEQGVEIPRDHIVIARYMDRTGEEDSPTGLATLLVSKTPFTAQDLEIIDRVVAEMQFELVLTPHYTIDPVFERITSGEDLTSFTASFPLNIAPPSDDKPFFFHMLRLRNVTDATSIRTGQTNLVAVYALGALLVIVCGLTLLCIIVPLLLTTKRLEPTEIRRTFPSFLFFAAIGLGFMLVEISQLQRLTVFLGHPTYGLSVALFSILLSSGIGSYLTQRVQTNVIRSTLTRLSLLLAALLLAGLLTPLVITQFAAATTAVRIVVAVTILFPLGLFMGMSFPMGMKIASTRAGPLTPWLWGINGATSVCASVFAVAISLNLGISASFWTGFSCYLLAFASILWVSSRRHPTPVDTTARSALP